MTEHARRRTPDGEERRFLHERTYQRLVGGEVAEERPFTDQESDWADRIIAARERESCRRAVREFAKGAALSNLDYLSRVRAMAATQADRETQVDALTEQANSVIGFLIVEDPDLIA